jgi:hypothetical protein
MIAAVLLVAAAASAEEAGEKAEKKKPGSPSVEKARAVVDAADKAYNEQNVNALVALLDKSYFGAGPTVGAKQDSLEAARAEFTRELTHGGRLTRDAINLHGDDDGDTVWYIADYTYVPKVGPGVLPVRRKIRTSGVVIRRGKEWKIAEWHTTFPAPDPAVSPNPHTALQGEPTPTK